MVGILICDLSVFVDKLFHPLTPYIESTWQPTWQPRWDQYYVLGTFLQHGPKCENYLNLLLGSLKVIICKEYQA